MPNTLAMAIVYTGCMGHYLVIHSSCYNRQAVQNGISVTLIDGSTVRLTHTAMLSITLVTESACLAHMFPDLISVALISIGQLFDDGFQAIFDADSVNIRKNGITILEVQHDTHNILWNIPLYSSSPASTIYLPDPTHTDNTIVVAPIPIQVTHCANLTIPMPTSANFLWFLHAACFSTV